jgi:hypothetical protein
MNPELTPGRGLRKAGKPSERFGSSIRSIRRFVMAPNLRGGDGQKVQDEGERFPVKVAGTLD